MPPPVQQTAPVADVEPQIDTALSVSEKADLREVVGRINKPKPVEAKRKIDAEKVDAKDDPYFKLKRPKYSADVFRPALEPPTDATALERLTYPRGLLGHCVQYMIDTAGLPDRWMALAGALCALGKALDRKVMGPEGNSVVLFTLVLAESGAGKNHILNCIKTILKAVGSEECYLGSGIASTQSVEQVLEGMGGAEGQPSVLIIIDEYGSFLNRISSKGQTGNVAEIPGILCSLWGHSPDAEWMGSIKVNKKKITVQGPAFCTFGASTETVLFKAIKAKQISGGFVSRQMVINAGRGIDRRVSPKYRWTECPKWLRKALKEVAGPMAPIDNRPRITGQWVAWDFWRVEWATPELRERYYDYEAEQRRRPSGEERDVWIRTPEYALRLATIVAMFRGSFVVDAEDLDWGIAIAEHSTNKIVQDLSEHGADDLELVDLIRFIRGKLEKRWEEKRGDRALTKGAIWKLCENKTNDHRKIWAAINHLVTLGEAQEVERSGVGRPTEGKWIWRKAFEE